jgi:hypothetical protein
MRQGVARRTMQPMSTNHILKVTLEAPTGERWVAIGGGESLDDALEFAVASAPADTLWRVLGWGDVFGD